MVGQPGQQEQRQRRTGTQLMKKRSKPLSSGVLHPTDGCANVSAFACLLSELALKHQPAWLLCCIPQQASVVQAWELAREPRGGSAPSEKLVKTAVGVLSNRPALPLHHFGEVRGFDRCGQCCIPW